MPSRRREKRGLNLPSQPSWFLFISVLKAFTLRFWKHPSTLASLRVLNSKTSGKGCQNTSPEVPSELVDQWISQGVGISEAERGASRSQARSTDFTGGVRDWERPTVHPEQRRYQQITPGEWDLRPRARNKQVARQINRFHRGSLVLRGFHGAPSAAHGS